MFSFDITRCSSCWSAPTCSRCCRAHPRAHSASSATRSCRTSTWRWWRANSASTPSSSSTTASTSAPTPRSTTRSPTASRPSSPPSSSTATSVSPLLHYNFRRAYLANCWAGIFFFYEIFFCIWLSQNDSMNIKYDQIIWGFIYWSQIFYIRAHNIVWNDINNQLIDNSESLLITFRNLMLAKFIKYIKLSRMTSFNVVFCRIE